MQSGAVGGHAKILSLLEPLGEELFLLLQFGLVKLVLLELLLLLAGQRGVVLVRLLGLLEPLVLGLF